MKQQDPNSKRAQRRRKREFNGSRPNRRASERLSRKTNGYVSADCFNSYTKPGKAKMW